MIFYCKFLHVSLIDNTHIITFGLDSRDTAKPHCLSALEVSEETEGEQAHHPAEGAQNKLEPKKKKYSRVFFVSWRGLSSSDTL